MLKTVILDPAVGSGGFLLVAMQEIILLIKEAESTVGWKSDPEEYKKRILPNLYGFDIEGEAIEIARLRLWLSLIIDQKEPEPLPNLDMNLVQIPDSLRLPDTRTFLDGTIEDLRTTFHDLKEKYLSEHDAKAKNRIRDQLNKIRTQLAQKTSTDPFVIEAFMPTKPNVVVMNPPYVRQESIPERLKSYYTEHYRLDKKSDLFAYFLVRALYLLSSDGVVSVISFDKWLETTYGISLQEKLKDYLIAVYGQRERTFGADINTAVSVYGNRNYSELHFTYLESYSNDNIRHDIAFKKNDLRPGKWFFLRAGAKFFLEKILPKLPRKLGDFSEIRRGFTSGANEFFFMKDISHLYNADYLSDPKKFNQMGIKISTKEQLAELGLIYVENEGGQRILLNQADVMPLIRSPRELASYAIPNPSTLCLYTERPGPVTKRYIKHGEDMDLPKRPTLANRNPWYKFVDLKPARILLMKSLMDRIFVPIAPTSVLCADRLYTVISSDPEKIWLYLNSTVFLLTLEMHCRRLGGAASDMMVEDYENMPVPNIQNLKVEFDATDMVKRQVLNYKEEMRQKDRRQLDGSVLSSLGFQEGEQIMEELHQAFVEAVEDRIIKGGNFRMNEPSIQDDQKH